MASIRKNTIKVNWKGVDETVDALDSLPSIVRRGVVKGLSAIALLMQNKCRAAIQRGPKTGKIYKKSSGVSHQASAPGEFPATDTGTLVRSVLGNVEKATLEAILSASTIYAKWLEYGTKKMAPRPFLLPTLQAVKKEAIELLTKFVRQEIKNGK